MSAKSIGPLHFGLKGFKDLSKINLLGRLMELETPLDPATGLDQTGLSKQVENLTGVLHRQGLSFCYFRGRQGPLRKSSSQLNGTAKAVFFVRSNIHDLISYKNLKKTPKDKRSCPRKRAVVVIRPLLIEGSDRINTVWSSFKGNH
jgi:hypothetical protein